MEDSFWVLLFWFLSGSIVYSFLSKILGMIKSVLIIREAAYWSILLLNTTHDGIVAAQKYKYVKLRESNLSKEEVSAIEAMDELIVQEWKKASINNVISSCPRKYRASLGFDSWQSAQQIIKTK